MLNIFCGRRRQGDIQWHLSDLQATSDVQVTTLSLDNAIDHIWGDLTREATIQEWSEHFRHHRVWITGGVPPCETWSAARWNDGGPPCAYTIIHVTYMWGMPWCTEAQHMQVRTGNLLLFTIAQLLAEHIRAGTCGWIEHPPPALWRPQAPSSFQWMPLRALESCPL
eukprot:186457-Pyramimonas_sp.AAC.1